jgi:uncharacterized protein YjbI with pentapeptide repeats
VSEKGSGVLGSWKTKLIRLKAKLILLRAVFGPLMSVQAQFRKSFDYGGRASRGDFWWWYSFVLISPISLAVRLPIAGVVLLLLCIPATLSLQARRIHDVGHSGWWMLVPIVGLWFSLRRSDPKTNRWGDPLRKANEGTLPGANAEIRKKVAIAGSDKDLRTLVLDESDFTDTNLHGCDFSGSSLFKSDFSRAIQVGSNENEPTRPVQFFGCDLAEAKFVGCELSGANFCACNLRGADFSGAELINADFRGADLSEVNFQDSNLNGADFLGSKLLNTKFTGAYIAMSKSMEFDGHEFA